MKKLLLYIAGVLFIAIATDLVAGKMLPAIIANRSAISSSLGFVLDSATEQTFIFGSSVAQVGVRPDVMEHITGKTCRNAGMGYQNMNYHLAVIKALLKRHTPETILLGIDRAGMHAENLSAQISFLYPFYGKGHESIDRLLEKDSPRNRWLLNINLYRYNVQCFFSSMAAATPDSLLIKGFVGRPVPSQPVAPVEFKWEGNCSGSQLNLLEEFIAICNSNGIRLIVFTPPVFGNHTECNGRADLQQIAELCSSRGVQYFDDSELPAFTSRSELFCDNTHLNHVGATLYTRLLAARCAGIPTQPNEHEQP